MVHSKSDVVVIGGGPGGITVALGLVRRNPSLRVTLIERGELGGNNLRSGTIPSKLLLHHARAAGNADSVSADTIFKQIHARIDEMQGDYDEIELQKHGIDVLKGEPEFTGRRSLIINDSKIAFKYAVIATGSVAKRLSIKGLDDDFVYTDEQLFSAKKLPKRLLIIGAGRTGIEIGQAAALLGSKVTIVNDQNVLLPMLNKEVRVVLLDGLRASGVTVLSAAQIHKVHDNHAEIRHLGGMSRCTVDAVCFAVGREPVLPAGLHKAKVKTKPEGIPTNLKHLTRNHRIFAIGDVASRSHFAHIAMDQAFDVVEYICSRRSRYKHRPAPLIPATLYTTPEVATVGLSYKEAHAAHRKRSIKKVVVPYWRNDRAKTENTEDGVLTLVVKKRTTDIVGVQIAGANATELIGIFCVALQHGLSLDQLGSTMLPYPTYHELINTASERFYAED